MNLQNLTLLIQYLYIIYMYIYITITLYLKATMIYAGFYTEMLACNPLNPIKVTMVSPSAGNRQLAKDCSPSNPMLINDRWRHVSCDERI